MTPSDSDADQQQAPDAYAPPKSEILPPTTGSQVFNYVVRAIIVLIAIALAAFIALFIALSMGLIPMC